jgi:hypothetical protein
MSTMDRTSIWAWRENAWSSDRGNLDGFSVEAVDGSIGKIDEATYDVGASYVVVDTGPWIFGGEHDCCEHSLRLRPSAGHELLEVS